MLRAIEFLHLYMYVWEAKYSTHFKHFYGAVSYFAIENEDILANLSLLSRWRIAENMVRFLSI